MNRNLYIVDRECIHVQRTGGELLDAAINEPGSATQHSRPQVFNRRRQKSSRYHLALILSLLGLWLNNATFFGQNTNWVTLNEGYAWGTTTDYGTPSIQGNGVYYAYSNIDYEPGIIIGGMRTSSWNSWSAAGSTIGVKHLVQTEVNSQSVGCSCDAGCPVTLSTHDTVFIQYQYSGFPNYYYYYQIQRCSGHQTYTCTGASGSTTPTTSWVSDGCGAWQNHTLDISGSTYTNLYFVGQIDPSHIDVQEHSDNHKDDIVVEIKSGTGCDPNHYGQFRWENATWQHIRYNYQLNFSYSSGTGTVTAWIDSLGTSRDVDFAASGMDGNKVSGKSERYGYAASGTIRFTDDNTNVRLHNNMSVNNPPLLTSNYGASAQTKAYLDFNNKKNNSIRFDKTFTGALSGLTVQNFTSSLSNYWDVIKTNNTLEGIGFYDGTNQNHIIEHGGYLWLGPSGTQSGITINAAAATDTIYVHEYLCCSDNADNSVARGHGVDFNVGSITNNTSGAGFIEVRNYQCNGSCGTTYDWLMMNSTATANLWTGNAKIWAEGTVTFPAFITQGTAKGTHNVYSTYAALVWNSTHSITSAAGTKVYENYYTTGNCCNSHIQGTGAQTYTFKATNDTLRMNTSYGYIKMDNAFTYDASGAASSAANILDMSGNAYVWIEGATSIKANDASHNTISSPAGMIKFNSTFDYTQGGTGAALKGLVITANGNPCGAVCTEIGGYVFIKGAATTTNTSDGITTIQSNKDTVTFYDGYTHTGEYGDLLVSGDEGVHIRTANASISRANSAGTGFDSIYSKDGNVLIEKQLIYNQTTSSSPLFAGYAFTVLAAGTQCDVYCVSPSTVNKGGYVWVGDSVKVSHTANGYTLIKSENDSVGMGKGYFYKGVDGSMTVEGEERVHIMGDQTVIDRQIGTTSTTTGPITDSIYSPSGNITIEKALKYTQTGGPTTPTVFDNYKLVVVAKGGTCTYYCEKGYSNPPANADKRKGGYLLVVDTVVISHKADGYTLLASTQDTVSLQHGISYSGNNGSLLVSGYEGVHIYGNASPNGAIPDESVAISRTNTINGRGNDSIYSANGNIKIEKKVSYTQNTAKIKDYAFTISANGEKCDSFCWDNITVKAYKGGFVMIGDSVKVVHAGNGYTLIESTKDSVGMGNGYFFTADSGSMKVSGHERVHIMGDQAVINRNFTSTVAATDPTVTDSIYSPAGNITIEKALKYTETNSPTFNVENYKFVVVANGGRCSLYCDNTNKKGGYLLVVDTVLIKHDAGDGYTLLASTQDTVSLQHGISYIGNNGSLLVSGYEGVHIYGNASPNGAIPDESVAISRTNTIDGRGNDSIYSANGNIKIEKKVSYTQNTPAIENYAFTISAKGAECYTYCSPSTHSGGYVLIGDSVKIYHTGEGYTLIESTRDSVTMQNGLTYRGMAGSMLVEAYRSVHVDGDNVRITRDSIGNDSIHSFHGNIHINHKLLYTQAVSAPGPVGSGLTVNAEGDLCETIECSTPGATTYIGGYVWIGDSVRTTNVGDGYTRIISEHHYVEIDSGMTHQGMAGELYVKGETRVDLLGKDVNIIRDSTGNDGFYAPAGHIFVEKNFVYDQSGADDLLGASLPVGSLRMIAAGRCDTAEFCTPVPAAANQRTDTVVNGYVWIHGNLFLTNVDNGYSKISSEKHYVQLDDTVKYLGQSASDAYVSATADIDTTNTTLLVFGQTGIDALQPVTVQMDSTGQATFMSYSGHIHFKDTMTFLQTNMYANDATYNGLSVIAQGACDYFDCNGRPGLGYVWMEKPLKTTTLEHGRVEIVSVHHNVVLDDSVIHHGVEGNLDVLALGTCSIPDCVTDTLTILKYQSYSATNNKYYYETEGNLKRYTSWAPVTATTDPLVPHYLKKYQDLPSNVDFLHDERGYVHIGSGVQVDLDSIGNASFWSKADVVQFDNAFEFNNNGGVMGDLYVDGYKGVRALGPVTTKNPQYITLKADGSPILHDDYKIHPGGTYNGIDDSYRDSLNQTRTVYDGSGNTRFNSTQGFVDFFSTFNHEAPEDSSRLDIEGFTRVKFADTVTIAMTLNHDTTFGEASILSDGGFVMFQKPLKYTSRDADFRVWAMGRDNSIACVDSSLDCAPGGHVYFGDSVIIDYTAQTALSPEGRTWIKSFHDDILIDTASFYYSSTTGSNNGMFWMQAGQDILARTYRAGVGVGDSIKFTQPGEKSMVWEAQGSIRTIQALYFDRTDAKAGNVVLKAGYDTTWNNSGALYAVELTGNQNPQTYLNWNRSYIGTACPPTNYTHRWACDDETLGYGTSSRNTDKGGDIWFQGPVDFDLSATVQQSASDSSISVLLRAVNSVYIDSTLTYTQVQQHLDANSQQHDATSGYFRTFAENGNIEAILNIDSTTSVDITIDETYNSSEVRFQAGNDPNTPAICDNTTSSTPNVCGINKQWDGNILFNKPLNFASTGQGYTLFSAERDIETQVDAPFTFIYSSDSIMKSLDIDAGRHVETHARINIQYADYTNGQIYGDPALAPQIFIRAGRLNEAETNCTTLLCEVDEYGTSLTAEVTAPDSKADQSNLTSDGTQPYEPRKGVDNDHAYWNDFAAGGAGNGSILLFDSLDIYYAGKGKIQLLAENGNIESDPYLHKTDDGRGNKGDGYNGWVRPAGNYPLMSASQDIQHDAQITIVHDGEGITELKAIDIRLHDKIAYIAEQSAGSLRNGRFDMHAYDSILTRNLQYVNSHDTGSVFITADKYKNSGVATSGAASGEKGCAAGDCVNAIRNGHIVLGYGADEPGYNKDDSIIFDFSNNLSTSGANVHILAGYPGYYTNPVTGLPSANAGQLWGTLAQNANYNKDRLKAYGGNITFDYMEFHMATGNGSTGGSTEIRTPNGNIWGKDSLYYWGKNGNLTIDAGLGSDDWSGAILWKSNDNAYEGIDGGDIYPAITNCSPLDILNTVVPTCCDNPTYHWRTGNIMMKGAHLNFRGGTGDATFRTREGFIDIYDAFTVDSMAGDLTLLAQMDALTPGLSNEYGDLSLRDFTYTPNGGSSGSTFMGADDNIMLNYGNDNDNYYRYGSTDYSTYVTNGFPNNYNILYAGEPDLNRYSTLYDLYNPYYHTAYEGYLDSVRYATYNVNIDGYLWYHNLFKSDDRSTWERKYHRLYRGCNGPGGSCSPYTGICTTEPNGARDLVFDFDKDASGNAITSGGVGIVASNFIDLFNKFIYYGGSSSAATGMGTVPGTGTLHGENVAGYGLYIKSQYNGRNTNTPEKRRLTCEECGEPGPGGMYEMTYVGFHDDARIHTQKQKSLIEAPVIEFFGHAELDTYMDAGSRTKLTAKTDSLIFHDSVVIRGIQFQMTPYTTDATKRLNMMYGVVNDINNNNYEKEYSELNDLSNGKAIEMEDRHLPVLELGYQRCNEPGNGVISAPNVKDDPMVGGDIIVAFKDGYKMPIMNTVVAHHARISFIRDEKDQTTHGEWWHSYICTDLLRIRQKVEFYTDPNDGNRSGRFLLESLDQMEETWAADSYVAGMYTRHLHTEPGSELSIPSEDSLVIGRGTVAGGYGIIHENVMVKVDGVLAPGYASLMEGDCQTPAQQGRLRIHDLSMEKDAELRISLGEKHPVINDNRQQTDTIEINSEVFFMGQIPVKILVDVEELQPGCHLFMIYHDTIGDSKEYVKNLTLMQTKYKDMFFSLDFSEVGKVYLCVVKTPTQPSQRAITLPKVEGVTYTRIVNDGVDKEPKEGVYYVEGHKDFSFTVKFDGAPRQVKAQQAYSPYQIYVLDQDAVRLPDGSLQFTFYQVVEPWNILFGEPGSYTANEMVGDKKVWSYRNTLYVNVPREDVVSVYNVTGVLNRKLDIPDGMNRITLERGVYVVSLKDGSIYKIIIK